MIDPPRFAPGSIIYNLEQIYEGSPWLTPALLEVLRAHTVWDYSAANIEALARLGIAARYAPVGYIPSLTRIPPAPAPDIDVLFHAAKVFEVVRVSYLLANRRFVVSETGSDAAAERLFSGGVAFAGYETLVDTCLGYLVAPEARAAVAARGFAIMAARREAEL